MYKNKNITFALRLAKNIPICMGARTSFNDYIKKYGMDGIAGQNPKVIWMTGLSGAGKTTLALALDEKIREMGYFTIVFDGDVIRKGINKDLGYSDDDRFENIRRTAEIAKLFAEHGMIVICSFISPLNAMRKLAKDIIGEQNFVEVFVDCPIEICEQRDVKGLYQKARHGLISEFTGITSEYEVPENADIEIQTSLLSIEKSVEMLTKNILPLIALS